MGSEKKAVEMRGARSKADAAAQLYGLRGRLGWPIAAVELGEVCGEALGAEPEGGAVGLAVLELGEVEGGVLDGEGEEGDVLCGMGRTRGRHEPLFGAVWPPASFSAHTTVVSA